MKNLESELSGVYQELSVRSEQMGASHNTQQRMKNDVSRLEQALAEKETNIQYVILIIVQH